MSKRTSRSAPVAEPVLNWKNVAIFAGAVAIGYTAVRFIRARRSVEDLLPAYPKNVLKKGGARSAVTGGHPEEMNGMPPALDPREKLPVYDGSDLAAGTVG